MDIKQLIDINNNNKSYINSTQYTTFFGTYDGQYFIYALCTKEDFTEPELIEVPKEVYEEVKQSIVKDIELIETFLENKFFVETITGFSHLKTISDNLTLGDILDID